ncbi:DUF4822 domain-containing protein [Nocardia inohanensis]|uniref:DUF4822 domain-containing protein n=1 Tax=Nocardia inohanensis TaxID=209246 RepID=UPI00082FBE71|nr:DUF4822 domain-containing protein [Nocardia inohanensis]
MNKIAPFVAALVATGLLAACSSNDSSTSDSTTTVVSSGVVRPGSPSAILSATAWETTGGKNVQGEAVPLTDPNVQNYVGFAYFKPDGTFTMYNLDDSPKMHGDWSVTPDGKTRVIVAKNDAGVEQFRRESPIVTLTDKEFTYRVYPDGANTAVYYDIVHTPTSHAEPAK